MEDWINIYNILSAKYKISWAIIPASCKSGWSYYAPTDSCYYFNSLAMPQPVAQAYCKAQEGSLASILSYGENQFILSKSGCGWLGLEKNILTGSWEWIDGNPVNYTNWYLEGTYSNDCELMYCIDGTWNSVSCLSASLSICKYKLSL